MDLAPLTDRATAVAEREPSTPVHWQYLLPNR